jgi:N-acyl-L-homoserine lactone synthetase
MYLQVKEITNQPFDLLQAYSLRYEVYVIEMNLGSVLLKSWPQAEQLFKDKMEMDRYDQRAYHFACFLVDDNENKEMVGYQRLLKQRPFMPELEYAEIGKDEEYADDDGEVSRLAVKRKYRLIKGFGTLMGEITKSLYRAQFHKCMELDINFLWSCTYPELFECGRTKGFPFDTIKIIQLENGEKVELAKLSWKKFEQVNFTKPLYDYMLKKPYQIITISEEYQKILTQLPPESV